MIKLKFYFDFCDYRSYFVAKELESLLHLPVQVEWIALDSYSLRAMSGESPAQQSEARQAYERVQAERYGRALGLKFCWPGGSINSGLALRASAWIMDKRPGEFEAFSRKLLHYIWGEGNIIDALTMQQSCEQFSFGVDEIMSYDSGRDQFAAQDRVLKQALADGVFDVPFLVLDSEHVYYGYAQTAQIREDIVRMWLGSLERERLVELTGDLVLSLKEEDLGQFYASYGYPKEDALQRYTPNQPRPMRQGMRVPSVHRTIPAVPAVGAMKVVYCEGDILEAYGKSQVDCLSIARGGYEILQIDQIIEKMQRKRLSRRVFLASVMVGGQVQWLWVQTTARALLSYRVLEPEEGESGFALFSMGAWSVGCLFERYGNDLNNARLLAASGAHVLVSANSGAAQALAMALCTQRWLVHVDSAIGVVDSQGRALRAVESCTLTWPAYHESSQASSWSGEQARTLLLCELPLSIGELRSGAELDLMSQGSSLMAATPTQKSLLSALRTDERFSFGAESLTLIPIKDEQVFVTELVSYKVLESLNKAPENARFAIINYWSELEFSQLERIRCVLASHVEQWRIPVVVVVGRQVVELWLSAVQSGAYRVEKSGEYFIIDLADVSSAQTLFKELHVALQPSQEAFLDTLEKLTQRMQAMASERE